MGRQQQWVYRVEPSRFPPDFPERLDRLRAEGGFSWRGLARALRVDARMLRRWRTGVKPDPGHLAALYAFAFERGLLHCLLLTPAEPVLSGVRTAPAGGCGGRVATLSPQRTR